MADREFILSPINVSSVFRVEQASMLLNSLHLMVMAEFSSGLDQWIYDVWQSFSESERIQHQLAMEASHDEYFPFQPDSKFLDYVEFLRAIDPEKMAHSVVAWMDRYETLPSPAEALKDEETYVEVMRGWYEAKKDHKGVIFHDELWHKMYHLLMNPVQLRDTTVEHLTMMWERFLEPEWKRRKPLLEETVRVYSEMDYAGLSPYELIEAVTGRDMRGSGMISEIIESSTAIVFVPSPHVGPYIGFSHDNQVEARLFFGARLPKGSTAKSSALSRSELLVRLNALADDTRLRMIELLIEHQELCAQDFINLLDLSQSSASRHLRQLTASGYLQERRKEVAKCYSLNADRIEDTITALRLFLVHD